MTDRWKQTDEILQAALERDPTDRAAFLDAACAGDAALRAKVETLLSSDKKAQSFLESPALEMAPRLKAEDSVQEVKGQAIGPYKVISRLGSGGMGEVYLARDTRLGRNIALKVLPFELTNDQHRVLRFKQEARTASALNHPNILTIYDIGESDSAHFIATEFVNGETLRHYLAGSPMAWQEALVIVLQAASALSAAHNAGIVHRDVKPENIMIRSDGFVKVVDFGLAKLTERKAASNDTETAIAPLVDTQPGLVMGTPKYMSPEQVRGLEVDGRSDIFSLGTMLYEMVAGHHPFEGQTTGDIIAAILEKDHAPVAQYSPNVPVQLQMILTRALQKDKEARYQVIDEMILDLKRLKQQSEDKEHQRATLPISSRETDNQATTVVTNPKAVIDTPQGLAGHFDEIRKQPTLITANLLRQITNYKKGAALALAILFFTALLSFLIYNIVNKNQPTRQPEASKPMGISRVTINGKATDASISPDGRYVAYVVKESGQQSLWVKHIPTSKSVQVISPAEILYEDLTFSSDSNYIYYIKESPIIGASEIYVVPVLGGTQRKIVENSGNSFALSPDSKMLAFLRLSQDDQDEIALFIANTDSTGEKKVTARKGNEWIDIPAWSPDGKAIAFIGGSGNEKFGSSVVEMQLDNGAEKDVTLQKWSNIKHLAWVPDGSGLVMVAEDQEKSPSQIWYLSYPEGEARRLTNDLNNYSDISITADSMILCTVQSIATSGIWVAANGDPDRAKQITLGAGGDGRLGLCWAPDGRIIYTSSTNTNTDLWIMDADGSKQRQLTLDSMTNVEPSVSLDGQYIVFASNRAGNFNIWRMDLEGNNPKQLTKGTGERRPQYSPDGRWVVYSSRLSGKPVLSRVSIDGGEPVLLSDRAMESWALSPDGTMIATLRVPLKEEQPSGAKIEVISLEGGEVVKTFSMPPEVPIMMNSAGWTPDGSAITYYCARNSIWNIWSQPLNGGPSKQVTNFTTEHIASYAWSEDGKLFAYFRQGGTSDAVLISNFK